MSGALRQGVANEATVLDDAEFRRIARVLHQEAGIDLPDEKRHLAFSRVSKRLRALGLQDFRTYCDLIEGDNGLEERRFMISALTTNFTHFFREPHHFEDLRNNVLPPLLEKARGGARVRIWSAGCSSGEEPYSIASCILAQMPDAASFDVKILATDIDQAIIERARAGSYPLSRGKDIPAAVRQTMFVEDAAAQTLSVAPALRRLITFNEMNLVRPWPIRGVFDVLFCRNVVIYFNDDTQRTLWQAFADVQRPGAKLYIGHSERLLGSAVACYRSLGITSYERIPG